MDFFFSSKIDRQKGKKRRNDRIYEKHTQYTSFLIECELSLDPRDVLSVHLACVRLNNNNKMCSVCNISTLPEVVFARNRWKILFWFVHSQKRSFLFASNFILQSCWASENCVLFFCYLSYFIRVCIAYLCFRTSFISQHDQNFHVLM